MQTSFTEAQLRGSAQPRRARRSCRTCVHCGFCTATCPTYVLLGDELDSPRGRIYLHEADAGGRQAADGRGGQAHRPLPLLPLLHDHLPVRGALHAPGRPRPGLHPRALPPAAAAAADPLAARAHPALPARVPAVAARRPPRPAVGAAPAGAPAADGRRWRRRRVPAASPVDRPQTFAAEGGRRARVALLSGCAQQVLAPQINEATIRLLTRHGVEVVVPKGMGCCGALTHHLGNEGSGLGFAKRQHRRLDEGARGRRPRRRHHQRLGLRHHGQGLRLHAARRSGLCREGGAGSRR